ncbi:MAG TPA: CHASE4 domain-containing protein [Solidesulfovibrio magneticus]|nr:CHASE4 domain-containing protein [Solidesulfovibrio magneticus]
MAVSIRKFTLIWICLGSAVLLACYIMLNSLLLTETFSSFAYDTLANNTVRVANFLDEEVQKLDDIIVDWAVWDDSYQFMQKDKPDFVRSNLNDRTLDSLDLAFIAFVDNESRVVWSASRQADGSFAPQLDEAVRELILRQTKMLLPDDQEGRIRGIARLHDTFTVIASCPISDSEGTAPKLGTLVMGRDLTEAIIKKIEEKTRLRFSLADHIDSASLGRLVRTQHLQTASSDLAIHIYDTNASTLSGHVKLKDITGAEQIDLIVSGDKEILKLGQSASRKSSIILISGGIALIGCILFLIERRVLRRILGIKSQITEINKTINVFGAKKEVIIPGDDEISELARYISLYISQITNYKLNLENLVKERTKRLQEKNVENEKIRQKLEEAKVLAEQANKTKTDFLAKVTHEIRTPMNAIKGMNDYLLSTSVTDDQRDCLTAVKESSDHLLTIVNDLLDLSKIEAGKIVLEAIDFNLKSVIESTTRLMVPLANKKNIELVTHLDDSADVVVRGDPARLRQILLNLTNNALKFTKFGGIAVTATATTDAAAGGYEIAITVSDTGVGIERGRLDTIFEPFTQGDDSTSRKFGGTGLGLSVCKQLVGLMHGEITVESTPGEGSSFTVRLPLPQGDYNAIYAKPDAAASQAAPLDRLMILVVDDNPMNLRVAQKVFSLLNQEPILAQGAQEALAFLKTALFDMVFLDIEMPEVNGIELCRLIRDGVTTPLNKDVPITAMTAYSLDTIRDECLACGMDDFITKPLDPQVLYEKILLLHQNMTGLCRYEHGASGQPEPDTPQDGQGNARTLHSELALLKLGGDTELYREVCEGYLEKYNTQRLDITLVQARPEPDKLGFEIHSLKGLAQQLGAEKLCAVATMMEKTLKNRQPCEDAAFARLLDAARETEQAVTDYLARTRPKAD